jgi:pimeloyl-ACP methyl ester carboxylesterase
LACPERQCTDGHALQIVGRSVTVALLPGFGRPAAQLRPWRDLLPDEVLVFDLPGYNGAPPLEEPTLEALAARYAAQIPRDAVVVGESLGGIVALKMAADGYRAVAVDPPLSTAKLWTLHFALGVLLKRNTRRLWMAPFVEAFFGYRVDGALEERNYWPLLDELVQPVHVIAAGVPLWPTRPMELIAATMPSVLDEADGYHLSRHPMVRYRQIEGPHTLLTERTEDMRPVLLEILAETPGQAERADPQG